MARDLSYLETLTDDEFKQAIVVLEKLESVSGSKKKVELLSEYKDNEVLREFFWRSLGTEKYYIRLKGDVASADQRVGLTQSFRVLITKVLPALAARKYGDKEAREKVTEFLSRCNPRVRKWYHRLLLHDLKIGVARTTINKVYGTGFWEGVAEDEFHFHGCCLAKKFEAAFTEKRPPKFPYAVEYKLDGERALFFVFPEQDEIRVYTRGLNRKEEIEKIDGLKKECFEIAAKMNGYRGKPEGDPIFLDGEFLSETWNDTSSQVGATVNFDEEKFMADVKIILFDWAPVAAYMEREFSMSWKDRKVLLMRATGATRPYPKVRPITEHIFVLGHKRVNDMKALLAFHDLACDEGFEGIMIKDPTAPHRFDRNHRFVLKMKPEDAATGIIKDVLPGDDSNGPAAAGDLKKIQAAMAEMGVVEDDGYYLHLSTDEPEEKLAELQEVINDWSERRLSAHIDGTVSYRYSERLGAFLVEHEDKEFNVGGGFTFAAGNDQRMEFWQKRDELIGVPVDFKFQKDKTTVATARFNNFVRLRFDLTENT